MQQDGSNPGRVDFDIPTGQHDGSRRGSKPAGSKPEGSKQCRWSELRQNRLVTSRLWARRPRPAGVPPIEHDPAILASFLSDAAHVPGGSSPGIVFPHDEAEVAAIVAASDRVLAIGAQSSLTGGATPRGEVLVSTRALSAIGVPADGCVHVGAGVPLAVLQQALTASGLYYPPVPTYDGAFVGGTIATNAAGAATFKYGSTRDWVEAITVVLASGDVLDLERGRILADSESGFTIEASDGTAVRVRVPAVRMPEVAKLSAGYFAAPGMDLIDLFIGSEGTLGVITAARLRVVPRPPRLVALVRCAEDEQAIALTVALCSSRWPTPSCGAPQTRVAAGSGRRGALEVSAVEYMDARSLAAVPDGRSRVPGLRVRARVRGPLLVQIEVTGGEDATLETLESRLASAGVTDDPIVALPDDDRGARAAVRTARGGAGEYQRTGRRRQSTRPSRDPEDGSRSGGAVRSARRFAACSTATHSPGAVSTARSGAISPTATCTPT